MNWSAVELREIRVFLVLAEELHFGRAAERLHLTSSRVSQIQRELESKLGVQLLHRTSRRVELTVHGKSFRDDAGIVYEQLVALFERTRASTSSLAGPLRLGILQAGIEGPELPVIVDEFE